MEGGSVVDEACVGLPGPLVEIGSPVDDAFAEVLRGEVEVLSDAAGGGVGDQDLRVALEARAFVEKAVEVEEAFGVGGGGVGEGGDDFVAVDGSLCGGRVERDEQGEGEEQGAAHEGEDIAAGGRDCDENFAGRNLIAANPVNLCRFFGSSGVCWSLPLTDVDAGLLLARGARGIEVTNAYADF